MKFNCLSVVLFLGVLLQGCSDRSNHDGSLADDGVRLANLLQADHHFYEAYKNADILEAENIVREFIDKNESMLISDDGDLRFIITSLSLAYTRLALIRKARGHIEDYDTFIDRALHYYRQSTRAASEKSEQELEAELLELIFELDHNNVRWMEEIDEGLFKNETERDR